MGGGFGLFGRGKFDGCGGCGGGWGGFGGFGGHGCGCGCGDDRKACCITAVRACCFKGGDSWGGDWF